MGEDVARFLALPLPWASLVSNGSFNYKLVPAELKQRVVQAYANAGGNAATNPVRRVPIRVSRDGAQLELIELQDGASGASEAAPTEPTQADTSADSTRMEFAALHTQALPPTPGVERHQRDAGTSQRNAAEAPKDVCSIATDLDTACGSHSSSPSC